MTTHRIGTRGSALARVQAGIVAALWRTAEPGASIELVEIVTTGDELADLPLERLEGAGFFTSALERALLAGGIDAAVHSYKDLPVDSDPALAIAAVPRRARIEDTLCARSGWTLATLPRGARLGTSSPRRTAQVRAARPDLEPVSLRGNVPTRLARVASGDLDAVVLAAAGLERLSLLDRATEIFPVERFLTAPAQGALAIQIRANDAARRCSLAALDHAETRRAVEAERAVLHELRGGCSVPVGAAARAEGERIGLIAGVFAADGDRIMRVEVAGHDPAEIGREAARRLLERGADEILEAFDREARVASQERR